MLLRLSCSVVLFGCSVMVWLMRLVVLVCWFCWCCSMLNRCSVLVLVGLEVSVL